MTRDDIVFAHVRLVLMSDIVVRIMMGNGWSGDRNVGRMIIVATRSFVSSSWLWLLRIEM